MAIENKRCGCRLWHAAAKRSSLHVGISNAPSAPSPPCETGDTRTACSPWLFGVSTHLRLRYVDITAKRLRHRRGVLFLERDPCLFIDARAISACLPLSQLGCPRKRSDPRPLGRAPGGPTSLDHLLSKSPTPGPGCGGCRRPRAVAKFTPVSAITPRGVNFANARSRRQPPHPGPEVGILLRRCCRKVGPPRHPPQGPWVTPFAGRSELV